MKGFIGDFFAARRDQFSIERFKELFTDLTKHCRTLLVSPAKSSSSLPPALHTLVDARKSVISILREIAECLVYADQHQRQQHFDLFADQDVMSLMWRLVSLDNNTIEVPRSQYQLHLQVQVQVIQTVAILVTQIKNSQSIFYLLSRNMINDLLVIFQLYTFRLILPPQKQASASLTTAKMRIYVRIW